MQINLLTEWKKEFNWNSSTLNPDRFCDRRDIEKLENILLQYFGRDYFEITINQNRSLENTNWIFYLLSQKDLSSLIALFEIGNLLRYLQTLSEEIQKKLKSAIGSYKEFQNLLFEIYTYRILDLNKIENKKKIWKGNQELEGMCKIEGKEFIFECCKSYTVDFDRLDTVIGLSNHMFLEIQKLKAGIELIGYIRIKENVRAANKMILQILGQYFRQLNGNSNVYINSFHDDNNCKFETMIYDEKKYFELINQQNRPDITFKIVPPSTFVQGNQNLYNVVITPVFTITQNKITDKLLKTIKKKRQQHRLSKNSNRIIFIDCEMAKNFRFPLLSSENMIDEEKIQMEINRKETNDIICVILRDYLGDFPKIKLRVFCKEEFKDVKAILENLKTQFNYIIKK